MRQRPPFSRRMSFDMSIEDETHIVCVRADLEKRHNRKISFAETIRIALREAAGRRRSFPPPLEDES